MSFFKKLFLALTNRERAAFITSGAVALISFIVLAGIMIAHATTTVPAIGGNLRKA